MVTVLLAILCFVLMMTGFAGIFLPLLPGVPLAWLGLFIYAIGTGFDRVSVLTVVLLFILMLISMLLDFIAPMLGARKYRASIYGIAGAFLGFIIGIIFFSFWGIILGPLVGAFIGELIARKQPEQAFKSALGAFIGFIAGTLFKTICILIMFGIFIISLF